MNREGAETFLRLVAEAEMRGQLARSKVTVVGQALTAVGALDIDTVEDILADFDLAVSVRQLQEKSSPRPAGTMRAAAAAWLAAQIRFGRPGPLTGPLSRASRLAPSWPTGSSATPVQTAPEPPGHDPEQGAAERFVPIGLAVPFHTEGTSGDLYLMSFAQTRSAARFIAVWGVRTPLLQFRLGLQHPDFIPFERFTAADDRGARYDLDFMPSAGPETTSEIRLRPTPPGDIRWLDVAAPPSQAVRIDLDQSGSPANGEPEVIEAKLSPGEHLLIMLAERLLTGDPDYPHELAVWPGPKPTMAAGFGNIVAGLQAADVLSPLSPVPARLAALCAGLDIGGHGIAAPPTDDLPEPWLSLLAHYQRRKPDTAPMREGYAAVAAALPEVEGVRLALLGLHNTEGTSSLHVLARGMTANGHRGPLGVDLDFPLSIWLRDSGGRWHAARPNGWRQAGPRGREYAVRLRVVPPLTRSTAWIEVLAGGRSAEVRTRLPLRWGYPL